MAKSKETINKKEREKKRLKQLQDKKQRLEERKANKKAGGSWEDMLMYPDENGNLQSTPPDPRLKKAINLEDIQTGVPKREDIEELPQTGIVKFFNHDKGFGFIHTIPANERIFFHVNDILQPLEESDKVQFSVQPGPRGPMAINVSKLS